MPCFRPLVGYRASRINPESGLRSIVWNRQEAQSVSFEDQVVIPCGQCRFCRLNRSREQAVRCTHEASLYESNCFLTLTYSPKYLPKGYHTKPNNERWVFTPAPGSIDPKDAVEFMKRLREKFGNGIRSYGCGEYGEKYSRPHFHICLFNFDFLDKEILKKVGKNEEHTLYTSKTLQELWPYGFSTVGSLTFESAAYVARYCTKKLTGRKADQAYERFHPESGEAYRILPEQAVCVSRRPGIGKGWYEKFGEHSRYWDYVVARGIRSKPPQYYDRLHHSADPESLARRKQSRKEKAEKACKKTEKEDSLNREEFFRLGGFDAMRASPTPRLYAKEDILELKFEQLVRGLEKDG